MSDGTRKMIARNFHVRGAARRGLVWVMACMIVAYFPQVAQALSATTAAVLG